MGRKSEGEGVPNPLGNPEAPEGYTNRKTTTSRSPEEETTGTNLKSRTTSGTGSTPVSKDLD